MFEVVLGHMAPIFQWFLRRHQVEEKWGFIPDIPKRWQQATSCVHDMVTSQLWPLWQTAAEHGTQAVHLTWKKLFRNARKATWFFAPSYFRPAWKLLEMQWISTNRKSHNWVSQNRPHKLLIRNALIDELGHHRVTVNSDLTMNRMWTTSVRYKGHLTSPGKTSIQYTHQIFLLFPGFGGCPHKTSSE